MRLRIISGKLKGRFLQIPDKGADFRPTLERTRESVAEILKPQMHNARTADICAGSGAFGFEMISRGAASVDFVECDRQRVEQLRKNSQDLNIANQCRIISQDIRTFISGSRGEYDIIFYDPPYDNEDLKNCLSDLLSLLSQKGILVYEHRRVPKKKDSSSEIGLNPNLFDCRTFGDTVIEFYHISNHLE